VFAGLGQYPGGPTLYDSSVYRYDGTLANMTPASDWVVSSALQRTALEMDGVDDTITIGKYDIHRPTDAVTVSAWVRYDGTNSSANDQEIFGTRRDDISNSNGYVLQVQRLTGVLRGFVYTSSFEGGGAGALSEGVLTHVAFRWSKATGVLHTLINGSVASTHSGITDSITYTDNCLATIGWTARTAQDDHWHGLIGDVMVWGRALQDSELQALAVPSNVLLDGLIQPYTPFYYTLSQETLTKIFKIGKLLLAG
jgi:hypothetical protein